MTKPASLIGFSGFSVTEATLEGGVAGARLCFAWCCDMPGNATSSRQLKATLSRFSHVAHELVEMAQHTAPVDHARRAELVDTTNDGNLDTLAIDTSGDGVCDTMIHLADLNGVAAPPAPKAVERSAVRSRKGSSFFGINHPLFGGARSHLHGQNRARDLTRAEAAELSRAGDQTQPWPMVGGADGDTDRMVSPRRSRRVSEEERNAFFLGRLDKALDSVIRQGGLSGL